MRPRVVAAFLVLACAPSSAHAQVPAGGEFLVNTYTTGWQDQQSVATDAAGNFVMAWISPRDGDRQGIFAQRYDASGVPRGAEFQVNTYTTAHQFGPDLASDAAGNFVVAWTSTRQDGSDYGVFAQRYDASGAPRGSEFQVNSHTTGYQLFPSVASDAVGNFVIAWYGSGAEDACGVFARRYDAAGAARGSTFLVNTYTTSYQVDAHVSSDAAGNFVVTWTSSDQDGDDRGIFAQRYDASGAPRGSEFQVNTYTTATQWNHSVASDAAGNFVVAWESVGYRPGVFAQRYDASGAPRGAELPVDDTMAWGTSVSSDASGDFVVAWARDASGYGVFAQRYDASGSPRGSQFRANTYTTSTQQPPDVSSDDVGNLIVAWPSRGQDGSDWGVFAQRYGGVLPAALAVDTAASATSDGNGVLEPGESVDVRPSWRNVNGAEQTFDGSGLSFSGPAASGVSYQLPDAAALYGTVADGATAPCSDCYKVGVTFAGTRPATHWDATLTERLTPDGLGQTKPWSLHVGKSFTDVSRTSFHYRDIETILHRGVAAGCSAAGFCPTGVVTRQQMSVFALLGKEGAGYQPAACGTPLFADVPASSPYCRWVEDLVRRGVVSGCGGGNYCPASAVAREQMPVFMLRTLDPVSDPPDCTTPLFADVPASSPFCRWIEDLARRGVVAGCGGGNYCPTALTTRAQMATFVTLTFGLSLYGP